MAECWINQTGSNTQDLINANLKENSTNLCYRKHLHVPELMPEDLCPNSGILRFIFAFNAPKTSIFQFYLDTVDLGVILAGYPNENMVSMHHKLL